MRYREENRYTLTSFNRVGIAPRFLLLAARWAVKRVRIRGALSRSERRQSTKQKTDMTYHTNYLTSQSRSPKRCVLFALLLISVNPALARTADEKSSSAQAQGNLKFSDLEGKSYAIKSSANHKALVLIFVTTDCPIANSYQPLLARLHKEFQNRGFEFLLIHEGPDQTPEKLREHAKDYAVPFSIVMDADHAIARQVGATKTPEVFVFAKDGAILYQGRVDDLHQGFGKKRAAVTREDLRIALRELDAGEDIRVPKTEAVGCSIPLK